MLSEILFIPLLLMLIWSFLAKEIIEYLSISSSSILKMWQERKIYSRRLSKLRYFCLEKINIMIPMLKKITKTQLNFINNLSLFFLHLTNIEDNYNFS